MASIVSDDTRLHYYGNTTYSKAREPDQQKKNEKY